MKITVIGHFSRKKKSTDGQTIKTISLIEILKEKLPNTTIYEIDTCDWKKRFFPILFQTIVRYFSTNRVIILPASNGVVYFSLILSALSLIKKNSIFYVVIGGWLPEFLGDLRNRKTALRLKRFKCIYVETNIMKMKLEKLGLLNVKVMPNFKKNEMIGNRVFYRKQDEPLQVCTFSRVIREKGIEDAIEAIIDTNKSYGKTIYKLDIYGPIEESYAFAFSNILENSPDYISYKGVVDSDKSVSTIKEYYLLLFPTYYTGEGFAGTLIDSLSAGVPILASDWKYNSEIVRNGSTGSLFPSRDVPELTKLLKYYYELNDIGKLKVNCINEAKKYTPSEAIRVLINDIV